MGYMLEFYSLPWAGLGAALGSGDAGLLQRARELQRSQMEDVAADLPAGREWEGALEDLIGGDLGRRLRGRDALGQGEPEEASQAAAVAMAALVRALGERLGGLSHRTRGGDVFREDFLGGQAQTALHPPVDLRLLTQRPLFGLVHSGYPSWGGLAAAEARAIVTGTPEPDDLPDLEDPDASSWLFALWEMLASAGDRERDLVTLYL